LTDRRTTVERMGHVAHIRFSNPPHNHLDTALAQEIADHLEALDQADDCRCIVLSSEGKVFCAGVDFGEGGFDLRPFYSHVMRMYRTRKPIIAAVQGAAVGAGLGLAVLADFRISCAEAKFSANFTRLGFHPGFGLSITLPRLIGQQRATKLFYTGRRIDGAEALQLGLIDECVGRDEVLATAFRLAEEIATSSPRAVQTTRATLRAGLANAIEAVNAIECAHQMEHFATQDFKEGIRAMAERRAPRFTGR
jgi:enoyl-CoA hydratase/carnithine racemase